MAEDFKMQPHQEAARTILLGKGRIYFPQMASRLHRASDSIAKFTTVCRLAAEETEIASDTLRAYRRMFPAIRKAWLRSARPKMSKRAWRRLRGKVKGLNSAIR